MQALQAFFLGLIQGLTEFLPVSSSGHLEIGKYLFSAEWSESLQFTVAVHGATVLSTLTVFRKDIYSLITNGLQPKKSKESVYLLKLLFSAIPVAILGLFFKDQVEHLFSGNIHWVAWALLATAVLLALASLIPKRAREISWMDSLIIGLAQAVAVIPGISRSGTTIATGLLLGNKKEEVTRFSFLMVILPVIGANLLEFAGGDFSESSVGPWAILVGFVTAYISGYFACRWMISIVSKGKLFYFALYCLFIGVMVLAFF